MLTNYPNGLSSMGMPIGVGNPFGNTYFVDSTNGGDGRDGKSTNKAFETIQKALDVAAAGDNVILSPGTHSIDVSTAALIPLANMQFIAAIPPMGGKPTTIITADADDAAALATIDVSGVGFYGIEFLLVAGGTTAVDLFDIAQTTAVNGLAFKDCWFNLNSVDHATAIMRALAIDDGTNALTGLVLNGNRFIGGDATTTEAQYIVVGVPGIPNAIITENVFLLESADGDAEGIHFNDPGAGAKSYGMTIRNNDFIGPSDKGDDAVGIVFAGAMTDNEIIGMIRDNHFAACGTASITTDEATQSCVNNYGHDAAGGALIDVVA